MSDESLKDYHISVIEKECEAGMLQVFQKGFITYVMLINISSSTSDGWAGDQSVLSSNPALGPMRTV